MADGPTIQRASERRPLGAQRWTMHSTSSPMVGPIFDGCSPFVPMTYINSVFQMDIDHLPRAARESVAVRASFPTCRRRKGLGMDRAAEASWVVETTFCWRRLPMTRVSKPSPKATTGFITL
jgi:hypothetical protein